MIKKIPGFNYLTNLLSYVKLHKKITAVVIFILAIIIFILFPKNTNNVLTEKVIKKDVIQSVSVTGDINANTSVNLSFQIGGKLNYLGVKQGDSVTAFETIATLDQSTAQKNLDIALLNYSEQRNTFDTTQQNNQNRTPNEALNNQMKLILENNQYDLNKSIDSVQLIDLARQESILTTPISGIVTRADVDTTGVNVTPATVFTVTDPNSLDFKMEVDEADIGQIKVGQSVNLSLDSFPSKNITLYISKIDFVSHTSSSGGNAFYVYATLSENSEYRVGMSGNADIIISERKNVLSVPSSSVFENNYVYVLSKNKFQKTKINLGLQSDTDFEVTSGVSEGETVALDPSSVPQNLILKK